MRRPRLIDKMTEPSPLTLCVPGKVEDDGGAATQKRNYMLRQRLFHPGRVLNIVSDGADLARKQRCQEMILLKKDGPMCASKLSGQSRLASRHLSAKEIQGWDVHFPFGAEQL